MASFCVLFIENGSIKKKVVYATLSKRLDFGLFLNDIDSTKTTAFDPKILQHFPNLDWKNEIQMKKKNPQIFKKVQNSGIYKQINMKDEVLESDGVKFYLKSFLTNQNYTIKFTPFRPIKITLNLIYFMKTF